MDHSERRSRAIDRLVYDMRRRRPTSTLAPPWWDHPYDALRGRTPTQALSDGDEHLVRDLIAHWYEADDQSALRLGTDFTPRVRIYAPRARQSA